MTPILGFIETYCHFQAEKEEERSHKDGGDDRGSGNIDESAGPVNEPASSFRAQKSALMRTCPDGHTMTPRITANGEVSATVLVSA